MPTHVTVVITTSAEERHAKGSRTRITEREPLTPLAVRVHGEYREMPGLRLTVRQAARLFSVAQESAAAVLDELQRAALLTRSDDGVFALSSEGWREVRERRDVRLS